MPKLVFFEDLVKYDIRFERSYISKLMRAGKFPRSAKASGGTAGTNVWLEDDIVAWRNQLIAKRLDAHAASRA